jgi:hypothetical protein
MKGRQIWCPLIFGLNFFSNWLNDILLLGEYTIHFMFNFSGAHGKVTLGKWSGELGTGRTAPGELISP